jgi:hypothetical protein
MIYTDGGRRAAGYRGSAGDCACRSLAVAAQLPYQEVYRIINAVASRERVTTRKRSRSSARGGVYGATMRAVMKEMGWTWTPTMQIGSGCTVHLRPTELPAGRIIVRLSKHYTCLIDGIIHDTHDPSRDGTRCVYGYWAQD